MKKFVLTMLLAFCLVLLPACGSNTNPKYPRNDADFTLENGAYIRVVGQKAIAVALKDTTGMSQAEIGDYARGLLATFYAEGYDCASIVTNPEADGTLDFSKTKTEEWPAQVFLQQETEEEFISGHSSFSLKEISINDYVKLFLENKHQEPVSSAAA